MAPVDAGWSSLVARRAHNPKVVGSNPAPATKHYFKPHLWGFLLSKKCIKMMLKPEIQQRLEPLVNHLGYEIWGCEYLPQGKYSLLRIYIDKPDGISLEDCELVSREVGALLDVEDPIQGNYSLEISSPGIPRPLFRLTQYSRYLGWPVQLKLRQSINGSKKLLATLVSVDNNAVELNCNETQIKVQFSDILKANLIGE